MTAWRERRDSASVFEPGVETIDDPVDAIKEAIEYMMCHDTGWDYQIEHTEFDGDDVLIEMENGDVWRATVRKEK